MGLETWAAVVVVVVVVLDAFSLLIICDILFLAEVIHILNILIKQLGSSGLA